MTNAQKLAKLKELAGQAGRGVYERLKIVDTLLNDHAYVAESWGDESKAFQVLEDDYFGDTSTELSQLIEMFRAFPQEAQWAKFKWNVSRLFSQWEMDRRAAAKNESESRPVRVRATVKQMEELQSQVEEAKVIAKKTGEEMVAARDDNASLRAKVAELEKEIAALNARLDEKDKVIERLQRRREPAFA